MCSVFEVEKCPPFTIVAPKVSLHLLDWVLMLYNNLHFWKSVAQAASLSGHQSSVLGPFCLYFFFFQCFERAQGLLFIIYFTRCLEQVSSL